MIILTSLVALFIFEQITNKLNKWGHLTLERKNTIKQAVNENWTNYYRRLCYMQDYFGADFILSF